MAFLAVQSGRRCSAPAPCGSCVVRASARHCDHRRWRPWASSAVAAEARSSAYRCPRCLRLGFRLPSATARLFVVSRISCAGSWTTNAGAFTAAAQRQRRGAFSHNPGGWSAQLPGSNRWAICQAIKAVPSGLFHRGESSATGSSARGAVGQSEGRKTVCARPVRVPAVADAGQMQQMAALGVQAIKLVLGANKRMADAHGFQIRQPANAGCRPRV